MDLPICRHRGEPLKDGHYRCHSAKLIVSSAGVTGDICRICPYVNHEPVPPRPPIVRPTPQHDGPGLFRKAMNLGRAVIEHATAGWQQAPPDVREARLAICVECPMLADRSCSLCGCNMEIKVGWLEQRCPHPDGDKWPE